MLGGVFKVDNKVDVNFNIKNKKVIWFYLLLNKWIY